MTGLISGLFISRCMTGKISDPFLNSDKLNFKMFLLNFRFEVFGLARQRHGITVRFSISCEKIRRITILPEYRQSLRAVIWQKPLIIHFLKSMKVVSCLITLTVSIDLIYLIIIAVKSERTRKCSKYVTNMISFISKLEKASKSIEFKP